MCNVYPKHMSTAHNGREIYVNEIVFEIKYFNSGLHIWKCRLQNIGNCVQGFRCHHLYLGQDRWYILLHMNNIQEDIKTHEASLNCGNWRKRMAFTCHTQPHWSSSQLYFGEEKWENMFALSVIPGNWEATDRWNPMTTKQPHQQYLDLIS